MKKLILLILFIFSCSASAENINESEYIFSSECVTDVHIQKSSDVEYWDMFVKINSEEAKKLFLFSKKNLKKGVVLKDGEGNILSNPRIMSTFSSPFYLSADSEKEAKLIKYRLLNTKGKCGEINSNS